MAALFADERYFPHEPEAPAIREEYRQFLIDYELAFPCPEQDLALFPQLNREWIFPGSITHCLLDSHTGDLPYLNTTFLEQLHELGCSFLQLRFYTPVTLDYLQYLGKLIEGSMLRSAELLLPATDLRHEAAIIEWVNAQSRVASVILHGAGREGLLLEGSGGMGYVAGTRTQINNRLHCGLVDPGLFAVNITAFTEALAHNSCLNRKISIDAEGYIRNCPSMPEHFGHIGTTTLKQALAHPGFRKHWHTGKDRIEKCRDCEFRYVCTDCRAYLDRPDDPLSAPLKCGYDPYTCTWEEWSTHPAKQQAIASYGMPGHTRQDQGSR